MADRDQTPAPRDAFSGLADRLRDMALFGALGQRPVDACGGRIDAWEEWVGPEVEEVTAIALRQQDLHDALVGAEDEEAWRAALERVVAHAAACLGEEVDDDAWHAPTTAAWSAAWTVCLEAVHLSRGLAVPADLRAQVLWFERGHWPCALVPGRDGSDPADYVVF